VMNSCNEKLAGFNSFYYDYFYIDKKNSLQSRDLRIKRIKDIATVFRSR